MKIRLKDTLKLLGDDLEFLDLYIEELKKTNEVESVLNSIEKVRVKSDNTIENLTDKELNLKLLDITYLEPEEVFLCFSRALDRYFKVKQSVVFPMGINPLKIGKKIQDLGSIKIDETQLYVFLDAEVRLYFKKILTRELIKYLFPDLFYSNVIEILVFDTDESIINETILALKLLKADPNSGRQEICLKLNSFLLNANQFLKETQDSFGNATIVTICDLLTNKILTYNLLKLSYNFSKEEDKESKLDFYLDKFISSKIEKFSSIKNESEILDPSNFECIKNLVLKQENSISIVPSSISLYNESTPYGGYVKGELICIVAPPKCGKSAFLIQETTFASKKGKKVLHCCLGDMSNFDLITRYLASFNGDPTTGSSSFVTGDNTISYFIRGHLIDEIQKPQYQEYIKNVKFLSLTMCSKDVFELVLYFKKIKDTFDFDMVIVDYDLNIRKTNNESLYDNGGVIYEQLKKCAKELNCVVLVATQPKNTFWNEEILTAEVLSESSRKQHTIDSMICINKNSTCKTLGTMNIAYMRRGSPPYPFRLYMDYGHSTLIPISESDYNQRLKTTKKVEEINSDLDL